MLGSWLSSLPAWLALIEEEMTDGQGDLLRLSGEREVRGVVRGARDIRWKRRGIAVWTSRLEASETEGLEGAVIESGLGDRA